VFVERFKSDQEGSGVKQIMYVRRGPIPPRLAGFMEANGKRAAKASER
jgi:hypothetical protein